MRVIKNFKTRIDPQDEAKAIELIECLMSKDRKGASDALSELIKKNIDRKIEKFTKSEPLI